MKRQFIFWLLPLMLVSSNGATQTSISKSAVPPLVDLAVAIDRSTSMDQNNRFGEALQAVRLACLVLEGRVQFIAFSTTAEPSPIFELKTQRADTIRWLELLKTNGGTRYIAAVDAAAAEQPKSLIFLSDGKAEEPADDVLAAIARQIHCPLHTIALETNDAACDLLGKMAAATGGGLHRVDQPTGIVDAFLEILSRVRPFRQAELRGDSLRLDGVNGEVLAIGFDVVPTLTGKATTESVTLSGSRIHVVRGSYPVGSTVNVTMAAKQTGRVIVLRFDQTVANMSVSPPVLHNGQAQVTAEVEFRDAAGKLIDPRAPSSLLSAEFEVLAPDGKTVERVPARALVSKPAVGAMLTLPVDQSDAVPYVIRACSSERSSTGAEFQAAQRQVVLVDPVALVPVRRAPPPDLQLLVIVRRQIAGRKAVFDSAQKIPELGYALDGDALSLELVRGASVDPREFASLGPGMRTRLITADGASTEVPITLERDRYVTAPVRVKGPGQLLVEVDVETEGLELKFHGRVAIEKIDMTLILGPSPLVRRLAVVPRGAVVPLQLDVAGRISARAPEADELLEVIRSMGLKLQWSLSDGAGNVLSSESHEADLRPWQTQFRLGHTGEVQLNLELVDQRDTVLDSIPWTFQAVDSPVTFTASRRLDNGQLQPLPAKSYTYNWLPGWCRRSPGIVAAAHPTRSPFLSKFCLAEMRAGGQAAEFDKDANEFRAAVSPGTIECVAKLRSYGWGNAASLDVPELNLSESLTVPIYEEIRPWPLTFTIVGLVLLTAGSVFLGIFLAQIRRRRLLSQVGLVVRAYGAAVEPTRLVDVTQPRESMAELLLMGEPKKPQSWQWVRSQPCNGHPVAARIKQHLDGTATLHAQTDFPRLKAGQSVKLSHPAHSQVELGNGVTLVVEPTPQPKSA